MGHHLVRPFQRQLEDGLKEKEKHVAKGEKHTSEVTQDRVGMLIYDYIYFVECIKPKVCILENVPEIKSSNVFHDALDYVLGEKGISLITGY